jgi:hypothetical protein
MRSHSVFEDLGRDFGRLDRRAIGKTAAVLLLARMHSKQTPKSGNVGGWM